MAIVRFLNILLKDKKVGRHVVPIVPDESRTFGMEGLFRQIGIWNQEGQKYVPEDHDQLMFYKESKDGQVLQEGIRISEFHTGTGAVTAGENRHAIIDGESRSRSIWLLRT